MVAAGSVRCQSSPAPSSPRVRCEPSSLDIGAEASVSCSGALTSELTAAASVATGAAGVAAVAAGTGAAGAGALVPAGAVAPDPTTT